MQKFRTMVQEIIERKGAEQALRESEERFRNMADTAPVMNWVTGPDKRFTFFTIFPSRGRDPPSWGGKGRKVAYGAVNFIIYHAGPMQPFTIAELDRYLERRREIFTTGPSSVVKKRTMCLLLGSPICQTFEGEQFRAVFRRDIRRHY